MGWRLKVSGYGKIESAEIETAPLTLFVGDNNSGKSYLLSLLWGIRNLGMEILFTGGSEPASEAEDRLLCWVREQVKATGEQGRCTARVSEIGRELQAALQERINRNKDRFVKAIFNSQDVELDELQITLTGLENVSLEFKWQKLFRRIYLSLSQTDGKVIRLELSEEERETGILEDDKYQFIISNVMDLVLAHDNSGLESEIYFPAARTGFMLTKDVVNKAGRRVAFNAAMEQETMVPFVRPVNHFLDVINDLTSHNEVNHKFAEVIRYLEKGMADGIVEMSSLPNKEVRYTPNGKNTGMPLRTVSAVVTELTPLILILKHQKYVDALFYEEPEMCLHPQLQQKMARVLCQLTNAGVQMNVTTHSDIILQHINNMIRLSEREDREEICRHLGYSDRDLLRPEEVRVYQLTAEAGAKTKVEELICGKNGFAVPTFNDALDRIMDEAYAIQE